MFKSIILVFFVTADIFGLVSVAELSMLSLQMNAVIVMQVLFASTVTVSANQATLVMDLNAGVCLLIYSS